jgi:glucose/arabinose dehydrogenase
VPNARSIARGGPGILYVSTRRDNRVFAVVDRNGDHKPEKVYTIAKDLAVPNGIAYHKGSLYIAQIPRILRLDAIDSHLTNPPKPVTVIDTLPTLEHHGWRYIKFGPDGWLYMPIGAPCNVCLREEPFFATIMRMKPDGTGLEVFASGVRNSVGFDWHPVTHELWFTENGRDDLGNEFPPDELNRAPRAGMHFGFPHCHAGVIADPELGDKPCTDFEPPVQPLGPHVAALGMRFYTGKMFPPEYKNAIILAEHGSWNRAQKLGYRVMVVRLDGNKAVSYEPLISGWLDEADQAWGRPVDVEMLDDGSLIVSDDWNGVLYRVTYKKK